MVVDDWFATVSATNKQVPDFTSDEWAKLFGESTYQYLPDEDSPAPEDAVSSENASNFASEKPAMTGLAGRYAVALFELALEAKALDNVAKELATLVEMLDESSDLSALIMNLKVIKNYLKIFPDVFVGYVHCRQNAFMNARDGHLVPFIGRRIIFSRPDKEVIFVFTAFL